MKRDTWGDTETAFHTENNDHKTPEKSIKLGLYPRNSKHFCESRGQGMMEGEKVTIKSYKSFCSCGNELLVLLQGQLMLGGFWTAVTKSCQLLCRWTEESEVEAETSSESSCISQ